MLSNTLAQFTYKRISRFDKHLVIWPALSRHILILVGMEWASLTIWGLGRVTPDLLHGLDQKGKRGDVFPLLELTLDDGPQVLDRIQIE